MNKYQLIDSIIVDLDHLVVQGTTNMKIVIESIQALSALQDGLRKEDATRDNLREQLAALVKKTEEETENVQDTVE